MSVCELQVPLPTLGGCSVSRAASGEGWTLQALSQLTNLAGWAGPAPFGCVSGCSEPLLASASPCSAPLPTCEQRGALPARKGHSTDRAPWLCWECAPKAGEGALKGWEPAACCTERCPLGKGTAARAAGWFEQLSSLKEVSVSNSQQKLSKL